MLYLGLLMSLLLLPIFTIQTLTQLILQLITKLTLKAQSYFILKMGKDSTSVVAMLQSLLELEQLLVFTVQLAPHLLELNSSPSLNRLHRIVLVFLEEIMDLFNSMLTQQKLQN